jgi:dipeptidyl aminopeptidase/acylaminoacyl peptidase
MAKTIQSQGLEAPLHEFAGEGHGFRKAETQRAVLQLETEFYGKVLGFKPHI